MLFETAAFKNKPITEQKLADHFGVSRTPVRDALKVLEDAGLVERRQRRGVYLNPVSIREIVEIFDVRAVLEGFAGRLAVVNFKKDDERYLKKLAYSFEQNREKANWTKCEAINIAFHHKILEIAGNSFLSKVINTSSIVEKTFKMTRAINVQKVKDPAHCSHMAIVKKLSQKDGERCERILRAHIQKAKRVLIELTLGLKIDHFQKI